jgi:hypothetical protein
VFMKGGAPFDFQKCEVQACVRCGLGWCDSFQPWCLPLALPRKKWLCLPQSFVFCKCGHLRL